MSLWLWGCIFMCHRRQIKEIKEAHPFKNSLCSSYMWFTTEIYGVWTLILKAIWKYEMYFSSELFITNGHDPPSAFTKTITFRIDLILGEAIVSEDHHYHSHQTLGKEIQKDRLTMAFFFFFLKLTKCPTTIFHEGSGLISTAQIIEWFFSTKAAKLKL